MCFFPPFRATTIYHTAKIWAFRNLGEEAMFDGHPEPLCSPYRIQITTWAGGLSTQVINVYDRAGFMQLLILCMCSNSPLL